MKVLPMPATARAPAARTLATATVDRIDDDRRVWVVIDGGPAIVADLAAPAGASLTGLSPGASVVVLVEPERRPVVVSAILDRLPAADAPPQELELAAQTRIVLRCGEASISILADGTILLHGERIDSHAEGIQRIKGAQVRIN